MWKPVVENGCWNIANSNSIKMLWTVHCDAWLAKVAWLTDYRCRNVPLEDNFWKLILFCFFVIHWYIINFWLTLHICTRTCSIKLKFKPDTRIRILNFTSLSQFSIPSLSIYAPNTDNPICWNFAKIPRRNGVFDVSVIMGEFCNVLLAGVISRKVISCQMAARVIQITGKTFTRNGQISVDRLLQKHWVTKSEFSLDIICLLQAWKLSWICNFHAFQSDESHCNHHVVCRFCSTPRTFVVVLELFHKRPKLWPKRISQLPNIEVALLKRLQQMQLI